MKRMTKLMLAGCFTVGLAGPALGQIDANPQAKQANVDANNKKASRQKLPKASNLCHANSLMDMTIRNSQGKEIGSVEDLIIDSQGRVSFVIVEFEDEFVKGDMLYAIPPQAFKPGSSPAGDDMILDTASSKFTAANGFSEDKYPQFSEQTTRDTYKHFDQTPYWEKKMDQDRDGARSNDRNTDTQPKTDNQTPRDNQPTTPRDAQPTTPRDNQATTPRTSAKPADRLTDEDRQTSFSQAPKFDAQYTWTNRFSEMVGKKVVNAQDENLGKLEDFVVNIQQSRVVYAILTDGGVLGISETLTAVPFSALRSNGEKKQYALDASKESLKASSFKEGAWPDLANREWAQKVHTQFNQDPYWAVYGYADTNEVDQHWRHDSDYNKRFDSANTQMISGKVTSVSDFALADKGAKGRQIMLRTDAGKTYTIHMGPQSYMTEQDAKFPIKEGDELSVTGTTCQFNGKEIMMASQVRTEDGKTLQLRDSKGRPSWDANDSSDSKDKNDSGNNRTTPETRDLPRPSSN